MYYHFFFFTVLDLNIVLISFHTVAYLSTSYLYFRLNICIENISYIFTVYFHVVTPYFHFFPHLIIIHPIYTVLPHAATRKKEKEELDDLELTFFAHI